MKDSVLIFSIIIMSAILLLFRFNPSISINSDFTEGFSYFSQFEKIKIVTNYLQDFKSIKIIKIYNKSIFNQSFKLYEPNNEGLLPNLTLFLSNFLRVYSLYEINNIYINKFGSILQNFTLYKFHPRIQNFVDNKPHENFFFGIFDSVIGLSHIGTHVFGHFFIDFLSPIMLLPNHIVKKSFFLIPSIMPYMIPFFQILNISTDQIISVPGYGYLYSKRYYVLDPYVHYFVFPSIYLKLSNFLRESFCLSSSNASRIFLYNRPPGRRHIRNFNMIYQNLTNSFKNYCFEIIDFGDKIENSVQILNQAKVLFIGFHGSAMANMFFMQKKSIFIEILTASNPIWAICISQSLGIFHIYSIDSSVVHHLHIDYSVNISIVYTLFRQAFEIIERPV